jgi:hypothetical protein
VIRPKRAPTTITTRPRYRDGGQLGRQLPARASAVGTRPLVRPRRAPAPAPLETCFGLPPSRSARPRRW